MKELKQKISLRNTFTVAGSDIIRVSHNTIVDLASAINAWMEYARYIAVGTGTAVTDRGLENYLCQKRTQLDEYNSDPSKGELFAAYSIRLTDKDVAAGTIISEAGLTPFENGWPLVNYSYFGGVTKREGEDIVIRAEVRLELISDKVCFVSGNNLLAEIFLGIKSFSERNYKIAHGTNYHKTAVMPRSVSDFNEQYDIAARVADESVIMYSRFTSSPYELVIMMDDKPVLRGFFTESAHVESLSGWIRKNSSVEIKNRHVLDVYNVKYQSQAISDVYCTPYVSRVTKDCPQLFPYKLPKNSALVTEPSGAFTAVTDDKEINVYTFADNQARFVYKIRGTYPAVDVCSDGSVFTGGDCLIAYFKNGEAITKKEFPEYSSVSRVLAVTEGGIYQIAVLAENTFYLLDYSEGTLSVRESIANVPDDFMMVKHDVRFIDYWTETNALYKSAGIGGNNANNETRLKYFCEHVNLQVLEVKERWMLLKLLSSGRRALCNRENTLIMYLEEGDEIVFCGELVFIFSGGQVRKVVKWGTSVLAVEEIPFDGQAAKPKSTAFLGGYLLFLYEDGTVKTFYPVEYGKVLFCPYANLTGSITFDAVIADDPMTGGNAVDVKFTIDYGGNSQ